MHCLQNNIQVRKTHSARTKPSLCPGMWEIYQIFNAILGGSCMVLVEGFYSRGYTSWAQQEDTA